MGDEPLVDPDAMWKPGYVAPEVPRPHREEHAGVDAAAGGPADEAQRAPDEPRDWFADYGRRPTTADQPDEPLALDPAWLRSPSVPVTATPDGPVGAPAVSRRRRPNRLVVGACAVGLVVALGAVWRVTRSDTAVDDGRRLASIPAGATPAWSVALDTGGVWGVIGSGSMIAVLESVTNDLVGLTAESGTERWRVKVAPSASIATLEQAGDSAIVLVEESTGDRSAAAYDVETGERLWRVDGSDRTFFVVYLGSVYRVPFGITDVAIERLDARTGVGLNVLTSAFSNVGWAHIATSRDDRVEIFDMRTLDRVAGPVAIGDVVAATHSGDRVLGLGPDATVRMYTASGAELSALQIPIEAPDLFDVTNTSEPVLLVMDGHEIIGYSLSGDRIAQLWRTGPVQVNEITDVGDNTYAVVQTVVAAGPNGGPVQVIDASTGASVAEPPGGSWVRLGRDGFVVEITDDEGLRQAIEAYGYDGVRRWRFDLTREQQGLFLVDGAVVVAASDPSAQSSTLTYLT